MAKTVAFIPVRGGSKSIPLKNIKPMCGKPLVYWTAAAASGCSAIDEVYIATDSEEIRTTVNSFSLPKIHVVGRSAETASDTASTESAMLEFADEHEFDTMVLIQATSPLLAAKDLDEGMRRYAEPGIDSVISVVEDTRFYWREGQAGAEPINYDVYARPRRQDFNGCLMENGAFYITSRELLLASKNRVSGHIATSVMPPETSFEIDEPSDWLIVEDLLARRIREQKTHSGSKVKLFLTDCDGCLTDGGMYYSENGDELKKFNTRDGVGFSLLKKAGIKCGIVTSENRELNKRRASKLQLDYLIQGCTDKLAAIHEICSAGGISFDELAYVGDDINDVSVLRIAGFSFCPADGQPAAKASAKVTTQAIGGSGVIREAAEYLLSI